jgi:hypothetical protein
MTAKEMLIKAAEDDDLLGLAVKLKIEMPKGENTPKAIRNYILQNDDITFRSLCETETDDELRGFVEDQGIFISVSRPITISLMCAIFKEEVPEEHEARVQKLMTLRAASRSKDQDDFEFEDNTQNMDDTPKSSILWKVFILPGKALLWFRYYFPSKGQLWVSARHIGNPIMEFIFALGFWFVFLWVISLFVFGPPA